MIRTDRRRLLQGAALAGGALGLGSSARALASEPDLLVHDSAVPTTAALTAQHPLAQCIDIARERHTRWQALRGHDGSARRIDGLTRWSDWVAIRGELERQGYRVASESRPRSGGLVHWSMTSKT
ncbi:twin-arginine translocation signal domain-containing protein [Novosphingobium sp. FKTRR1]|uniref:twin-arginine translocation signal domain-containing protein n=1 Tax=Novosphingobium sp. FKTRR1 TaxID=2879118 RepID=UPI001CF05262|nr:twin-arginine translocation signal domain-containing protein [Novosphingobium sp. FKTRR1]